MPIFKNDLNFFVSVAQDLIGLKETWCDPCIFPLTLKEYIDHIGMLHKYSFINNYWEKYSVY